MRDMKIEDHEDRDRAVGVVLAHVFRYLSGVPREALSVVHVEVPNAAFLLLEIGGRPVWGVPLTTDPWADAGSMLHGWLRWIESGQRGYA